MVRTCVSPHRIVALRKKWTVSGPRLHWWTTQTPGVIGGSVNWLITMVVPEPTRFVAVHKPGGSFWQTWSDTGPVPEVIAYAMDRFVAQSGTTTKSSRQAPARRVPVIPPNKGGWRSRNT